MSRPALRWATVLALLVGLHSHAAAAAAAGLGTAADLVAAVSPTAQLALTAQSTPQQQQQLLQAGRPLVVAHRGASGPLPEHTAAAYLEGIREGADFIECDVVVTRDLQLICRHEPNLNGTTDAWEWFGHRATSYTIDGKAVQGVFACDLTLSEVRQLRARQRWAFRDHSHDGLLGLLTFGEYLDLALAADRPVGVYPEAKHPTWHNQLPALQAAGTSIEELMVKVLHSRGYATSAPFLSAAWRSRPAFIQSFEVTSLKRFAALTPVPLALLLDKGPAPDTGLPLSEILSDAYLAQLSSFVTVMAPWKAMLYTTVDRPHAEVHRPSLVLPHAAAAAANGTDSSRRLLGEHGVDAAGAHGAAGADFVHPDVPLSRPAGQALDAPQALQSTGLAARLHGFGFQVHTYTIRDEGQFVLPSCQQDISCEFAWLFGSERLDGGFADWPGTMHQWVQQHHL